MIKKKLYEVYLYLRYIRFSRIKTNENILLYGISRSGTTLLAELLVKLLNARLIWEPLFPHPEVSLNALNPFSVHEYTKFKLGWAPHVANQNEKELNTYFDKFYQLKKRNIRHYRFTNHKDFKTQDHTVFKFCFGNFMYSYFQQRYAFKAIVLLRHPFAIAASSLGFGNNYDWHKKNYAQWSYNNSAYSSDFMKSYEDQYHLIVSGFTLLVFQAVTQFAYVLNNLDQNSIVVFYEDMLLNPTVVKKDLEEFFNLKFNDKEFSNKLNQQSFSSKKGHTEDNKMKQLSKWKSKLSDKDVEEGLKIFKAFNFSVYSHDVLPLKENLKLYTS